MPEWRASSHAFDLRLAERDGVLAELQAPLRPLDFSGREKRKIVVLIAREEVINTVLDVIHAGHKCGPGYGRDRGKGCTQLPEGPLLLELCQIWQLTFCDKTLG